MKIIDKLAVVILSFLISLFGFVVAICLFFFTTIGSPQFMINVLESRGYYDLIYSDYSETIENYAIPAGVGEGVFTACIPKDEFNADVNNIVLKAYSDSEEYAGEAYDYDGVYNRFYNCIVKVAEQQGIDVDQEVIPGIENVSKLCADAYSTYVTVPFIDTIGSYSIEFGEILSTVLVVASAFGIFLIVLLLLSKQWRGKSPYYLTIASVANGLMLIILPSVVLISGKIRHINIDIKSMYNFAVGYAEGMMWRLILIGAIIILIGVIISLCYRFIFKRKFIE